MKNPLVIDEKFSWQVIKGKHVLELNMSGATEEEVLAALNRFSYMIGQMPPAGDGKPRLLVDLESSRFTLDVLWACLRQARIKTHFIAYAGYHVKGRIIVALIKALWPYTKFRPRQFNTRQEALDYLLTCD